jgi:DNA-binding protein HU-beta
MGTVVTKVEIVSMLSEKTKLSKADTERFMDAINETVLGLLLSGKEVPIFGLGKLKTGKTTARTQKTPKGTVVDIPAKTVVKFVTAKVVKEKFNAPV